MDYITKRLFMRKMEKDDYPKFCSVFSNEAVMKYSLWDCFKEDELLLEFFKNFLDNEKEMMFTVFNNADNRFLGFGCIEIRCWNSKPEFSEIGYFILPDFWGKGYATEIAQALTGICFKTLGVHKVVASCNVNNEKSEKVMKKTGMQKEGEFRKERFKDGEWVNELRYGILKEEWG